MKVWSWRQAVQKAKLSPTTKLVLYNLSIHMNDAGDGCYPTTKTQSEATGLSERSVCTHLDLAESAGFIVSSRHGFGGLKWARNEYRAAFPNGTEIASAANEGTERRSVHGTEPDDKRALNVVQSNSSIELSKENSPIKPPIPPMFDIFWKAWPDHTRKVDRKKCCVMWKKRNLDERAVEIMDGLRRWIGSHEWAKEKGEFIPMPSTWLNQERWTANPKPAERERGLFEYRENKQEEGNDYVQADYELIEE